MTEQSNAAGTSVLERFLADHAELPVFPGADPDKLRMIMSFDPTTVPQEDKDDLIRTFQETIRNFTVLGAIRDAQNAALLDSTRNLATLVRIKYGNLDAGVNTILAEADAAIGASA
jgi:hypothetical protein